MITLRKINSKDAQVLLKWGRDPYYHELAGFANYSDLNMAKAAVSVFRQRPASYAIDLDGKMIGLLEFYPKEPNEEIQEVGFLIDKDYQGRGYMQQALKLGLEKAFREAKEIWAGCYEFNEKPQKLLEKFGFEYQYTIDQKYLPSFVENNEKFYLLNRERWNRIIENTKA
ncbi:MAG: GNAT family N-acetyltransferase [Lactobacillus sp.]|nr:GNAT family N-acetyltransferase [Lactobacillus sp.]